MRLAVLSATLLCLASGASAQTFVFDHIHLAVPDPDAAANWYVKNFGARVGDEGPTRLMFGSTRFVFIKSPDVKPSAGTAVDHIGFSVTDLDAKMKELEAAGVKIVTPARDIPRLFKVGFVEDPWGTKIEIVQDPEVLGLHHVHFRSPDPEATLTWFQTKFGGKRVKIKDRLDAVIFPVPGFSTVYIMCQKGDAEPIAGHSIDHLGWRPIGPLKDNIEALRAKGVTIVKEPGPAPPIGGRPANYAFVEGPDGMRIEITERLGLKPGQ